MQSNEAVKLMNDEIAAIQAETDPGGRKNAELVAGTAQPGEGQAERRPQPEPEPGATISGERRATETPPRTPGARKHRK
eukprot:313185-Rhodomonas_salina.1